MQFTRWPNARCRLSVTGFIAAVSSYFSLLEVCKAGRLPFVVREVLSAIREDKPTRRTGFADLLEEVVVDKGILFVKLYVLRGIIRCASGHAQRSCGAAD